MFTQSDKEQITGRGSSLEVVEQQVRNFISGFPPLKLENPALEGAGMRVLTDSEVDHFVSSFEDHIGSNKLVKFVPASGAASRMFKALFGFVDSYKGSDDDYEQFSSGASHQDVYKFFKEINRFAFYDDLKKAYDSNDETIEEAHVKRKFVSILQCLLEDDGLGYGSLPKGLLKFHKVNSVARTPAEEHLVEAAHYAKDGEGTTRLHFTVSPEHREKFSQHINEVRAGYEDQFGVKYDVSYSEQKPSTDTVAVDMDNAPFRNHDGSLLFRPAGHGALIENLNDVDADVVFVKNIDNVVPDHLKSETYRYKKALAGILMEEQKKTFSYLNSLVNEWTETLEEEVISFMENNLNLKTPSEYGSSDQESRKRYLIEKLNRPIRVCGMVANVGDPGGGPFWARNSDGSVSLQIVETAQIDLEDEGQKDIFQSSSHFNPVDLVCGVRNYKGEKFNLPDYVDPKTGFITAKSKDGRDLKAQELPGLWNGAMSDWISIFVEVPVITFNPVKQVNDLLKETHQPA